MKLIFVYILLFYYFSIGKKRSLDYRIDGILAIRFNGREFTILKLSNEVGAARECVERNPIITQLKGDRSPAKFTCSISRQRLTVWEHRLEMSENSCEWAVSLAESYKRRSLFLTCYHVQPQFTSLEQQPYAIPSP